MKASLLSSIAPMRTQFARKNVPSFCPEFRTTIYLGRCDYRMIRTSMKTNCRKRKRLRDSKNYSKGNELKSKVVMKSLQLSFPNSDIIRLKSERKTMQIKNDISESDALTINK